MPKNSNQSQPKAASSNWLALQKTLPKARKRDSSSHESPRKRRKIEHSRSPPPPDIAVKVSAPKSTLDDADTVKNGESVPALRKMIFGHVEYSDLQRQPGKYLALDCEMVGVGPEGAESVLARVSLVNFHGAVQLDEFVRPRERVVDYRTEFSGVRAGDMVNAKPFPAVQSLVAALIKDRVLIGHAVHNDLKALLLSHPHTATRDTQYYAGKSGVVKSKRIALRKLVQQELGATIQGGEHSSVTDARATMAVYRLHRKEWEKSAPRMSDPDEDGDDADSDVDEQPRTKTKTKASGDVTFPGGGRKGVSSGLGTVVKGATGLATTLTLDEDGVGEAEAGSGGRSSGVEGGGGRKGSIVI
ncbi:ribonuclease H-like domain-containing protein [Mycena olivaceomarginata]|nr:ribonuclease H-like domain-containing protein [Mycena olivaceomarginata]